MEYTPHERPGWVSRWMRHAQVRCRRQELTAVPKWDRRLHGSRESKKRNEKTECSERVMDAFLLHVMRTSIAKNRGERPKNGKWDKRSSGVESSSKSGHGPGFNPAFCQKWDSARIKTHATPPVDQCFTCNESK